MKLSISTEGQGVVQYNWVSSYSYVVFITISRQKFGRTFLCR